jgi:hypothetical protein
VDQRPCTLQIKGVQNAGKFISETVVNVAVSRVWNLVVSLPQRTCGWFNTRAFGLEFVVGKVQVGQVLL